MTEDRLSNAIPLNTLSGIGPSLVSKFARLGLESLQDLLLHLPARYEDRTKLYPIGEALPGMTVTVQGEVLNSDISFGRKRMLTCRLRDDSGVLTLRFFHFNAAMKNSLSPGQWVTAYGEIRRGRLDGEIIHPEYHVISERSQVTLAAALTPVYPTTEGVRQATLRCAIDQALKLLDITPVPELPPPELSGTLMSLADTLRMLHRPPPEISLDDLALGRHPAQRRLILEELLAHNLSILTVRAGVQKDRALPFSPTGAWWRKSPRIWREMSR